MSNRILPRTDKERNEALKALKTKKDSLPVGSLIISEATADLVDDTFTAFDAAMLARSIALSNQGIGTTDLASKRARAVLFISHFFQSFFNGITRGVFKAEHCPYYQLDLGASTVPVLRTDKDITEWGDRIITGEPLRVTAGGTAMSNPSLAELTTVFNAYKTANTSHSNLKDAYDLAQKALDSLRANADRVILQAWNEIEAYYSYLDIEARRRFEREWGITFDNTPVENSLIGSVMDTNHNIVVGADIKIEQLNITVTSDSSGEYWFGVVDAGTYTLTVSKTGFTTKTVLGVTIEANTTNVTDIVLVANMGTLSMNVRSQGVAVAGATVEIVELGISIISSVDGMARNTSVIPGIYTITVTKAGYTTQTFTGISIIAGSDRSLTSDLISSTGTLIAIVMSQGQPVTGATVTILEPGLQAVSEANGECTIEFIDPGTYSVQAAAPGKVTQTFTITITANVTSSLSFDLTNLPS